MFSSLSSPQLKSFTAKEFCLLDIFFKALLFFFMAAAALSLVSLMVTLAVNEIRDVKERVKWRL